jgi:hypothetical protein
VDAVAGLLSQLDLQVTTRSPPTSGCAPPAATGTRSLLAGDHAANRGHTMAMIGVSGTVYVSVSPPEVVVTGVCGTSAVHAPASPQGKARFKRRVLLGV